MSTARHHADAGAIVRRHDVATETAHRHAGETATAAIHHLAAAATTASGASSQRPSKKK